MNDGKKSKFFRSWEDRTDQNQNAARPNFIKKMNDGKKPKFFRSCEERSDQNRNAARPNIVESPPAIYSSYWPQPDVRPVPRWNWYIPYFWLVVAEPATAVWPGVATAVSTPEVPEPTSVNTPTMEATSPTRKRKREKEDEEDRLKAERDKDLMQRISKLSREQIEKLFPYRREMARKFAPKTRTPAEQRKRDKNTEACRMSRRRKELLEILKEYPDTLRKL